MNISMWLLGWNPLVLATYALLFLAVVALWVSARLPHLWAAFLVLALALGYISGVLTGYAIVPIALLAAACWLYRNAKGATMRAPLRVRRSRW